ncbi:DNA-3-methyladenine glycosylase [candidate division WWE3 bacterium CG_4_8_14_3_um_filter_42_11]|uniref:Putative 3-methyladenine DNA glycosylase n=2 Tax=Katanobacteria TaxID=422282 RepID=A0A2M7TD46_UNCKA|nr:MAG: DNA-3-methyladenine glycosylase [candidate division WWE3 bacterium CG_4_10_14_0_2_um_filter_42_8]PJC69465.1 MAG: DNA-3-methyladenine glycosylase [candidate division WWE3 bacterium CG_4_8_14_3_um_filter_42_11]
MNSSKLSLDFYLQPTLKVAQQILGKYIIHNVGRYRLVGKIVETEAYIGPYDLASHASRGKTQRNAVMFEKGGKIYVYLIYGMYYCLNIVTEAKDYPAAALVRAVEPIEGIEPMWHNRYGDLKYDPENKKKIISLTNGPGKLCRAFGINQSFNGLDLGGERIYLAGGARVRAVEIAASKRIGVDYAKEYRNKPWRFHLKNNLFVSKI